MTATTRRFGPRLMGSADFLQRFWSRVQESPGGCWLWLGERTKDKWEYGLFTVKSRTTARCGHTVRAHRVAFMLANGVWVPNDIEICHGCDNPPCVAPHHLFAGTRQDNVDDMVAKGRWRGGKLPGTHCGKGHALTPDNVYLYGKVRTCRTCFLDRQRQRRREGRWSTRRSA